MIFQAWSKYRNIYIGKSHILFICTFIFLQLQHSLHFYNIFGSTPPLNVETITHTKMQERLSKYSITVINHLNRMEGKLN